MKSVKIYYDVCRIKDANPIGKCKRKLIFEHRALTLREAKNWVEGFLTLNESDQFTIIRTYVRKEEECATT